MREAAAARRWNFFSAECFRDARGVLRLDRSSREAGSLGELAALLRPDGLIAWGDDLSGADVRSLLGSGGAAVFLQSTPGSGRSARVFTDPASVASLAARELLLSDRDDFAYVPFGPGSFWSRERGEAFGRCIALAGKRFHGSPPETGGGRPAKSFLRWLAGLPRPCGLFAANDLAGDRILGACAQLGLSVPGDVAVVGVDDEDYICENAVPTLSSVAPDLAAEGRAAVELLAERMARPAEPPRSRAVPAARLVRRASSRPVGDARVARALEGIRLHACDAGFSPADVVREIGLSHSPAFCLFKRIAGRTILDAIHAVRLDRAKELLAAGTLPEAVADRCGYASLADFRRVFRKRVGQTVRAWTIARRGTAARDLRST